MQRMEGKLLRLQHVSVSHRELSFRALSLPGLHRTQKPTKSFDKRINGLEQNGKTGNFRRVDKRITIHSKFSKQAFWIDALVQVLEPEFLRNVRVKTVISKLEYGEIFDFWSSII